MTFYWRCDRRADPHATQDEATFVPRQSISLAPCLQRTGLHAADSMCTKNLRRGICAPIALASEHIGQKKECNAAC